MKATQGNLKALLPYGAITEIADKLGISQPAVSDALKKGRPSHPAVQAALRIAQESGAIDAAKILATINS